MGSYAVISVNNKNLFYFKNEINPMITSLFDEGEKVFLDGASAVSYAEELGMRDYDPEDIEHAKIRMYKSKSQILKNRLYTLGFNEELVSSIFAECRKDAIANYQQWLEDYTPREENSSIDMSKIYSDLLRDLHKLTFKSWLADIRAYIASPELTTHRNGPFELIETADERVVLFAVIESLGPSADIELDLSDLYEGGWLDDEDVPTSTSIAWSLDNSPPIILTEGVFDRKVLLDSLELLHPELTSYLKFLDTDYKTEGSASAVLKMLKNFAAAGISNRILVILDNDTAAREAMTSIPTRLLPSHFKIITLPRYDSLSHYPCVGPQGVTKSDINGTAASIELYLGLDVLRDNNGNFCPIQWTGYSTKMKAYQGEVIDKQAIQKRFVSKLKTAKENPSKILKQDWSGLELIIETILEELSALR